MSEPKDPQGGLTEKPSMALEAPPIAHDAVFGEITEEGPNYRDVGWLGTVALMMKTQFGLGVLSIPQILDSLGLVPGIICLLAVATITTWSNYVIGTFKMRHPEVYAIDDAGELLFGRVGREVLGIAVCIYWIFCSGSGLLSTSIGLNAVSAHGTCTAVFVAVAAIASFSLASIRTLGKMKWAAWAGVASVFTAVMMATIAVGIQERPPTAPKGRGPWVSDYKLVGNPSFVQAITAVSSIVFAYAGTPGFFPIAAEMRDPSQYTRSLLICQTALTSIYIAIGTVIYYYCGSYVASPALGSAGTLIKKVAYGIALPGLVASTVIVLHFSSKYLFIRILRGSEHLTANTFKHWATWLSCTFAITVSSYLIASGIPIFSDLVSLIGALLGTFMSFQPMGCMWLYDNWKNGRERPTLKWILLSSWSILVIVSGSFLMVAGTYGSVVNIIASSKATPGSSAWSCVDNSNS
ncbi:transmembrane amino acid transporter protein-domain-containing protein [Aspergillus caelatus]|uniref:Transmembrane amino acid transporter protein-domain-containing protein n=2 Tax=Aspergillus subgen. Circumdati TaxID=2720871 RepID=A0A5N6ZZU9_9EURO|nr:transmembrane amino acid transporter protein-domain-containing protein [Aspergillus caelatus]KAE8362446.1 transmembrane amino acid transporter protein-domain-containing protein [Aspergillus caelatus]KAE8414675.1 transmembrane amino acid transporter protein-domain-containing protein [Aspergillus pseudocaelatus]